MLCLWPPRLHCGLGVSWLGQDVRNLELTLIKLMEKGTKAPKTQRTSGSRAKQEADSFPEVVWVTSFQTSSWFQPSPVFCSTTSPWRGFRVSASPSHTACSHQKSHKVPQQIGELSEVLLGCTLSWHDTGRTRLLQPTWLESSCGQPPYPELALALLLSISACSE